MLNLFRCSDASGLCSWLNGRSVQGLPTFMDVDEEGVFCACGFVLPGAQVLVNSYEGNVIAIIDSTHNKPRYGLRMFSISTITQNGSTKVTVTC